MYKKMSTIWSRNVQERLRQFGAKVETGNPRCQSGNQEAGAINRYFQGQSTEKDTMARRVNSQLAAWHSARATSVGTKQDCPEILVMSMKNWS
jgi:hypothetical protein